MSVVKLEAQIYVMTWINVSFEENYSNNYIST